MYSIIVNGWTVVTGLVLITTVVNDLLQGNKLTS